MTEYLVLIWGDEDVWESADATERQRLADGHAAFRTAAGDAAREGHELQVVASGRTVRMAPGGGVRVSDGPFLETKEVIGGFYLLDAEDMDRALELVSLLPEVAVDHSAVEIRPIG